MRQTWRMRPHHTMNYPRLTALPLRRRLPLGARDFVNSANKASKPTHD
jgi:hypothetical protein